MAIACFWLLASASLRVCGQTRPDTTRILFIGNSFTINNDCPDVVKEMAFKAGLPVHIESCIHLGGSVEDFIRNKECWRKVKSRDWNYIIFQDYQTFYGDTTGVFPDKILSDNISFQDTIKKMRPCSKIIYVAGWEKKDGFKDRFPKDNFDRLAHRIMNNYQYLNSQRNVNNIIAPVGYAWLKCLKAKPRSGLFSTVDNRHPDRRGTYLYAAVIFSVIFRQSPGKKLYYSGISEAEARYFCQTGYETVLENQKSTNMNHIWLPVKRIGGILVADLGYRRYQWYKNGMAIKGATRFFLSGTDSTSIYSFQAVSKRGCRMKSETCQRHIECKD